MSARALGFEMPSRQRGNALGKTPGRPAQIGDESRPVESAAGIGLAAGRHMLMTSHIEVPPLVIEGSQQRDQTRILRCLEALTLKPLQFDADRKVIAVGASAPLRCASMPGAFAAGHELHALAIAPNKKMR